jgi:hypothetical protein
MMYHNKKGQVFDYDTVRVLVGAESFMYVEVFGRHLRITITTATTTIPPKSAPIPNIKNELVNIELGG